MMPGEQKWLVISDDYGWFWIVPDPDTEPHGTLSEDGTYSLDTFLCPCKPAIDFKNKQIIHNSFYDKYGE